MQSELQTALLSSSIISLVSSLSITRGGWILFRHSN